MGMLLRRHYASQVEEDPNYKKAEEAFKAAKSAKTAETTEKAEKPEPTTRGRRRKSE